MKTLLLAMLLWAGLSSPASAVEINPDGEGQVLIAPLWTTTGGFSTLIHLRNGMILRIRILDEAGSVVFSGNLYQYPAVWTAAIAPREGGGSRLVSNAEGCLVVDGPDGVKDFGGSIDIDANHGSMEVIVMGNFDYGASNAGEEGQKLGRPKEEFGCEGVENWWNEGPWAEDPDFGLTHDFLYPDTSYVIGEWSIINVERGVLFDVPDTALVGYSDRLQHTRPGSALPNLASGHDSGTDEGRTGSRYCTRGVCFQETWATPLDAMAGALRTHVASGDYAIEPSLGASTDVVFHFPLTPYYAALDEEPEHPLAVSRLRITPRDRSGDAGLRACPLDPFLSCSYEDWRTEQPFPTLVVSFNPADGSSLAPSAVLGIPASHRLQPWYDDQYVDYSMPALGTFDAAFGYPTSEYPEFTSNEGIQYLGAPVLPVVFQQFVNGTLQGEDGVPQRANYGKAYLPSQLRKPDVPTSEP